MLIAILLLCATGPDNDLEIHIFTTCTTAESPCYVPSPLFELGANSTPPQDCSTTGIMFVDSSFIIVKNAVKMKLEQE